jgi:hypothetical protein
MANSIILIAAALATLAVVLAVMLRPPAGQAPEDQGADWDAEVRHDCWQCGTRLSGPENGESIRDVECWECYCSRNGQAVNRATPGNVMRRPQPH